MISFLRNKENIGKNFKRVLLERDILLWGIH